MLKLALFPLTIALTLSRAASAVHIVYNSKISNFACFRLFFSTLNYLFGNMDVVYVFSACEVSNKLYNSRAMFCNFKDWDSITVNHENEIWYKATVSVREKENRAYIFLM